MLAVLTRAGLLIAIIFLGYGLRRVRFFDEHAFPVLSKLVLNVTLPCAIIKNFSAIALDPSMLSLFFIGFAVCGLFVLVGFAASLHQGTDAKVMSMLNYAGFNIGCFAMPYVSSFLGASAVVSVCMFDVGNSLWCVGITNALCICLQQGGKLDLSVVGKRLLRSVSTITYVVMMILGVLHLRLPAIALEFVDIVAPANTPLAMFMLGLGMNLSFRREHFRWIGRAFVFRFGFAMLVSMLMYLLLPFAADVRLGLSLAVLAPVASSAPVFTHDRGCDVGLAASWNTLTIFCSMLLMTVVILFTV